MSAPQNSRIRVAGIVLCGGQSRRMGRPKAWLPFGDERMLQRIVRLLGDAVHPVVVVAASGQDVPPLPANVQLARDVRQGRGPLEGMAAGFQAIGTAADAAYVSSCDVPFLRPAFIGRLVALLQDSWVAVPRAGGFHHPLAAVYRVGVAATIQRLLANDRLRPLDLFEAVPTRIVEPEELSDVDPGLESLRNLNTPEQYREALRQAGLAERL